jgi:hypothetical protein
MVLITQLAVQVRAVTRVARAAHKIVANRIEELHPGKHCNLPGAS